ncbi:hypothetical protein BH23THE1_BH23THE1_19910 [soil metagenome]
MITSVWLMHYQMMSLSSKQQAPNLLLMQYLINPLALAIWFGSMETTLRL